MYNPFTYPPVDVCEDLELPGIPAIQDCVSYAQLRSEICGLIIRPFGATGPISWNELDEWLDGHIDNTDPSFAHYIAGKGNFLPAEKTVVSLAGGRVEENRERVQRLTFNVLNMDAGHLRLGRLLQANKKDFRFYIVTIGGISGGFEKQRIIGGYLGMNPIFSDAVFSFQEGNDARESMQIILDAVFLDFPEMPLPT